MAARYDEEIARIDENLRVIDEELSALSQRSRSTYRPGLSPSPGVSPPKLRPFDSVASQASHPQHPQLPPHKRKEIEARRYNGKEPVCEYLMQFELTARRNGWTNAEKAVNLLCALDGPARSLLSELDINTASYTTVKDCLTKRFGPVLLPEVHEQALQELKLARNQPIRELTTEVTRLAKLAYPELDETARERFAVKALINSIPDRDTTFYIKEKNPGSLDEVCVLYERYKVLTGHPVTSKPAAVKGVKPPEKFTEAPEEPLKGELTEILAKQSEMHSKQLAQLTETFNNILQQCQVNAPGAQVAAPPPNFGYASGPQSQGPPHYFSGPNNVPRNETRGEVPFKPCPRCKQPGHWARNCPQKNQQETCFRCGQTGHMRKNCQAPLNTNGPTSAPHAGPPAHRPY